MRAPSVFVRLEGELHALLANGPDPVLPARQVSRGRQSPLVREQDALISVRIDKSIAQSGGATGSPVDWLSTIDVEIYKRAGPDEVALDVVDALLGEVYARIADAREAEQFIALSVQDLLPDPQIEWDRGDAQQNHFAAVLRVRIVHRTKPGSLEPWDS